MTKDKYVLDRVKIYITHKLNKDGVIEACTLDELIDQWEFDYELEEQYEKLEQMKYRD